MKVAAGTASAVDLSVESAAVAESAVDSRSPKASRTAVAPAKREFVGSQDPWVSVALVIVPLRGG